jgi:hypothetical protein
MKPWEETWTLEAPQVVRRSTRTVILTDVDIAPLIAAAPAMARMLLAREWDDTMDYDTKRCCSDCEAIQGEEHRATCPWLVLMKAAGAR